MTPMYVNRKDTEVTKTTFLMNIHEKGFGIQQTISISYIYQFIKVKIMKHFLSLKAQVFTSDGVVVGIIRDSMT